MQNKFRTGDRVRVRSAGEIRDTLDANGELDGVPFMREMLEWCGREFRVSNTAHKTCDTVNKTGGRSLTNTVHLDDLRCNGAAHGGCDAHCLIFWKEAWLVPAASRVVNRGDEQDLAASTIRGLAKAQSAINGSTYSCQATELPRFTRPLPWWDVRQYIDDVRGGNHKLSTILRLGFLKFVQNRLESGIGFRFLLPLYNFLQARMGGVPRTPDQGCIALGARTPHAELNLQPGERVEVKPYDEIQATLDSQAKNRGMRFDIEMKVHCGQRFRVAKRVEKIINEQTGELVVMKTPSVILDGGVCLSQFSTHRMFCPRALPNFWREIWLRRVPTGSIPLLDLVD